MNERTLQAAAAALEQDWTRYVTDGERELLRTERPDLFPKSGPANGLVIKLGFDPGGPTPGRELVVDLGPQQPAYPAGVALKRAQLRARFKLPAKDCGARRPNSECDCLTSALDELADAEILDKATIVTAARTRHKRRPVRRWHKPTRESKKPAATREAATVSGQGVSTRKAETPQASPRPRYCRSRREPAHPLSFAAFKQGESGPSIRGILDRRDLW